MPRALKLLLLLSWTAGVWQPSGRDSPWCSHSESAAGGGNGALVWAL